MDAGGEGYNVGVCDFEETRLGGGRCFLTRDYGEGQGGRLEERIIESRPLA